MIRVGFINLFAVREWLGGLNYLRNLLHAVCSLENRRIDPVFISGYHTDRSIIDEFSFLPVIRTAALDRGRALWLLRKLSTRAIGSDLVLRRIVREHGINILSHSGDLGRSGHTPSIAWVADLQHRYLPNLFSSEERALREQRISRALRANVRIIVSSKTAACHLLDGAGPYSDKIRVLHFVSGLMHGADFPARDVLRDRYQVNRPYVLLPNQFWAHKNHAVVVEALRLLKNNSPAVTIVATGMMHDPRQPEYVRELLNLVSRYGLENMFRPLGVVPYADMLGLMRDAIAVMNPSLFEGWSTSVEEARSMGKRILLSDIPVHVEQAPERGVYFNPRDVEEVAERLLQTWTNFDAAADRAAEAEAARLLPRRLVQFASAYQSIVIEGLEASRE